MPALLQGCEVCTCCIAYPLLFHLVKLAGMRVHTHGEVAPDMHLLNAPEQCRKLTCVVPMYRLVKLLAAERALDTVVWQLLASVACPGYTIHTVVALAHAGLLHLEVGTHHGKCAVGCVSNLYS